MKNITKRFTLLIFALSLCAININNPAQATDTLAQETQEGPQGKKKSLSNVDPIVNDDATLNKTLSKSKMKRCWDGTCFVVAWPFVKVWNLITYPVRWYYAVPGNPTKNLDDDQSKIPSGPSGQSESSEEEDDQEPKSKKDNQSPGAEKIEGAPEDNRQLKNSSVQPKSSEKDDDQEEGLPADDDQKSKSNDGKQGTDAQQLEADPEEDQSVGQKDTGGDGNKGSEEREEKESQKASASGEDLLEEDKILIEENKNSYPSQSSEGKGFIKRTDVSFEEKSDPSSPYQTPLKSGIKKSVKKRPLMTPETPPRRSPRNLTPIKYYESDTKKTPTKSTKKKKGAHQGTPHPKSGRITSPIK